MAGLHLLDLETGGLGSVQTLSDIDVACQSSRDLVFNEVSRRWDLFVAVVSLGSSCWMSFKDSRRSVWIYAGDFNQSRQQVKGQRRHNSDIIW